MCVHRTYVCVCPASRVLTLNLYPLLCHSIIVPLPWFSWLLHWNEKRSEVLADWRVGHAQIEIQVNGDAYVNFTLALWKTVDQTTPSHYCNDVHGTCDFITCEVTISKTCSGWVCDLSLSATSFKATLVHRDADEIPIRPNPSVCCRLAVKYNPVGINVKSVCDNTAISCNQLCKKTTLHTQKLS